MRVLRTHMALYGKKSNQDTPLEKCLHTLSGRPHSALYPNT